MDPSPGCQPTQRLPIQSPRLHLPGPRPSLWASCLGPRLPAVFPNVAAGYMASWGAQQPPVLGKLPPQDPRWLSTGAHLWPQSPTLRCPEEHHVLMGGGCRREDVRFRWPETPGCAYQPDPHPCWGCVTCPSVPEPGSAGWPQRPWCVGYGSPGCVESASSPMASLRGPEPTPGSEELARADLGDFSNSKVTHPLLPHP